MGELYRFRDERLSRTPMKPQTDAHLYEQVADRLAGQIAKGVYRDGDRVPSVRQLSAQLRVSVSTVIEAYRLLEAKGLVAARPQSGYYVCAPLWRRPAEPGMSEPPATPTTVSVSSLALEVLHAAREEDMLQLGVAVPDPQFLPARQLNRVLAAYARSDEGRFLKYDFPPGCEPLRIAIARRAARCGCDCAPEDIVTTAGCQEALSLSLRAVASAGDTIAIESPAFYGTLQTIETLGMKVLEIPTHPREGMSLEALGLALEQWDLKAVMLVANFSNPLGALMPEESKKRLVRLVTERGVPLIEDDIYGDIAFSPERPTAVKAYDRRGIVFYCSSFSKTLAPGMRVGWVIPPARYRERIEHLKYVNTAATPTLAQHVIAEFLDRGGYDRHLRKVRVLYAGLAERMTQAITRYFPGGTRVTQPAGGFVLWVELPEAVDALDLHRRALAQRISIAPGPLFSATRKYRNFVRLTCAVPWSDRVERSLAALGRMAGEMARGRGEARVAGDAGSRRAVTRRA